MIFKVCPQEEEQQQQQEQSEWILESVSQTKKRTSDLNSVIIVTSGH